MKKGYKKKLVVSLPPSTPKQYFISFIYIIVLFSLCSIQCQCVDEKFTIAGKKYLIKRIFLVQKAHIWQMYHIKI